MSLDTRHLVLAAVAPLLLGTSALAAPRLIAPHEGDNLLNLSLEGAFAFPVSVLERAGTGRSLAVKLDVPLRMGFAVQGSGFLHGFDVNEAVGDPTLVGAGLGVRYRLPVILNPWIDANALLVRGGGRERAGVDVGAGFGITPVNGILIGPFARFAYLGAQESVALAGIFLTVGAPKSVSSGPEVAEDDSQQQQKSEPQPPRVSLEPGRVVIRESIFFATNESTVLPQSFGVLDEVAELLQKNPQVLKVRVDGHTDDVGEEDYNLQLSEARARAVRDYLVSKGVAAERLEHKGFGESKPLVEGTGEDARAKNRRVEFTIVDPPNP